MSYSYYRKRNPLQVIDKDNIVQSLPSTPFRSKNPNQQAKQEAVTVDMLDCDGQKHIAMIVHNQSTKRSFGNLFSPLRPAKGFKKSKQNTGPTSDEIVKDKLPSIPASSSTKHPRDADLVVDSEKENLSEGRRRKKSRRLTMTDHITRVLKVELGENGGNIYDSCPEVVDKIEKFLQREGVTLQMFTAAIDVHGNSLRSFLQGKDQDQCSNPCYKKAYIFFEKMRLLEETPKTLRRMQNEAYLVDGFDVKDKSEAMIRKQVYFDILPGHTLC